MIVVHVQLAGHVAVVSTKEGPLLVIPRDLVQRRFVGGDTEGYFLITDHSDFWELGERTNKPEDWT